jgi:N-acetylglucosamine-6-sulfatase
VSPRRRARLRAAMVRVLAACAVTALCAAAATTGTAAAPRGHLAAPRPNVIMILTDDQSLTDMSVMRHVRARLGQRGTTFTHAYSPYPLCCPARATLLTGQYAHNHHVFGNLPPYGGFQAFDDTDTLPLWLQRGGYSTAMLGKYLNGYPTPGEETYEPPGWNTWRVPVSGIYDYRRWTLNVNGTLVPHSGTYETDFVAAEASGLVKAYAAKKRPYFLWAGFLAPHWGRPWDLGDPRLPTAHPSPRYAGTLANVRLPAKKSINEVDVSDKPQYIQDSPMKPWYALRQVNEQRLESLLSVDDAVNSIMNAVKASGEADNTLVIFTSDNGYLIGEHRRVGKDIGYEEATRVPLVIAGPGFETGQTRDQKVTLADIAPTIAQEAGVKPGLVEDGKPLTRIAADPRTPDTRTVLLEGGPTKADPTRWYTGIHTNRFVYVEYRTSGERELYDLKRDPEQLRNLAVRTPGTAEEAKLARALSTLRTCAGRVCRESVDELAR